MGEEISETKVQKLLEKLNKNPVLARKLGLLEDSPTSHKRKDRSPIKFNNVLKNTEGKRPSKKGKLPENAPETEASTSNLESQFEMLDNESDNAECDSEDELDQLDNLLSNQPEEDESLDRTDEFDILSGPEKPNWVPDKKAFKFFLKAADIDLKKEVLSELTSKYQGEEDVEAHFCPPKFPPALWASTQSSQADVFRLKAIYKVQQNLFLAIKPLLDVLAVSGDENTPRIIEAIQLLCSSNLMLNRLRRSTVAPSLKADLRKQILALPVTHNNFFGEEFNKAADNLIKEQTALDKIMFKKPMTQRLSTPQASKKQFFRG